MPKSNSSQTKQSTAYSRLSVCGLFSLRIILVSYLYTFIDWEIMLLKHILNLAAVFKQHGVFNDASRPTNTYSPI